MKQKTCCFTGHREILPQNKKKIGEQTLSAAESLIKEGVDTFICGGAMGYDMLCARVVLHLKKKYENVRLVIAIPCEGQEKYFSSRDKESYYDILEKADEKIYISQEYFRGCMHKRNRYMVDNSAYLIAYCTKNSGGSYYTREYAIRNGVLVINITEDMSYNKCLSSHSEKEEK